MDNLEPPDFSDTTWLELSGEGDKGGNRKIEELDSPEEELEISRYRRSNSLLRSMALLYGEGVFASRLKTPEKDQSKIEQKEKEKTPEKNGLPSMGTRKSVSEHQ